MPNILFIGDIVGRPGRSCIAECISKLKTKPDIVIANAENAAGGAGLTAAIAKELTRAGIHGLTLGDHTWDQKGFELEIDSLNTTCRPANLPATCPGKTHIIVEENGFKLGVFTVLGRQFMGPKVDCPFLTADKLITELEGQIDAILVEIHAEATSEKIALGRYLDGRVAAVIGTHTHIPTADAGLLPKGTAYMTDAGMTGPYDSVLGREVAPVIQRFLDGMPQRFPVAENNIQLSGLQLSIDSGTQTATACKHILIPYTS